MSAKKTLNVNMKKISRQAPTVIKQETLFAIDYDELGVSSNERDELIKCEHDIVLNTQKATKHLLYYCKAIYDANQIFSNHNKGSFRKWLEKIGINKDKANLAIRRYTLYLNWENKIEMSSKLIELPVRAVRALTSEDKQKFEETEILEIVSSDNPTKILKNMEVQKSKEKLNDKAERKTYLLKQKIKKTKMIEKLKAELKEIENDLKTL